jgi:hypothetical protein
MCINSMNVNEMTSMVSTCMTLVAGLDLCAALLLQLYTAVLYSSTLF